MTICGVSGVIGFAEVPAQGLKYVAYAKLAPIPMLPKDFTWGFATGKALALRARRYLTTAQASFQDRKSVV